jgi:hypothetical protein
MWTKNSRNPFLGGGRLEILMASKGKEKLLQS